MMGLFSGKYAMIIDVVTLQTLEWLFIGITNDQSFNTCF
jgi:hypothetical protein